jgi:acetyl esterase/lipase
MVNKSAHAQADEHDIHDIIVIGTSAGGIEALQVLVRDLPTDIATALFAPGCVYRHRACTVPLPLPLQSVSNFNGAVLPHRPKPVQA